VCVSVELLELGFGKSAELRSHIRFAWRIGKEEHSDGPLEGFR
jgi:hypothetical protein